VNVSVCVWVYVLMIRSIEVGVYICVCVRKHTNERMFEQENWWLDNLDTLLCEKVHSV